MRLSASTMAQRSMLMVLLALCWIILGSQCAPAPDTHDSHNDWTNLKFITPERSGANLTLHCKDYTKIRCDHQQSGVSTTLSPFQLLEKLLAASITTTRTSSTSPSSASASSTTSTSPTSPSSAPVSTSRSLGDDEWCADGESYYSLCHGVTVGYLPYNKCINAGGVGMGKGYVDQYCEEVSRDQTQPTSTQRLKKTNKYVCQKPEENPGCYRACHGKLVGGFHQCDGDRSPCAAYRDQLCFPSDRVTTAQPAVTEITAGSTPPTTDSTIAKDSEKKSSSGSGGISLASTKPPIVPGYDWLEIKMIATLVAGFIILSFFGACLVVCCCIGGRNSCRLLTCFNIIPDRYRGRVGSVEESQDMESATELFELATDSSSSSEDQKYDMDEKCTASDGLLNPNPEYRDSG